MPPQVGVGTAALIFRDDKLLMLKRAGSHGAGTWSVPGGWVDYGESMLEGCAREVREEVGLDVEPRWDVGWTEDHFPEGIHDICFWILCNNDGESEAKILEPDKCDALRWMTQEEIEALPESERFIALTNFMAQVGDWLAIWAEYGDGTPV